MKLMSKLSTVALATSMVLGTAVPTIASAEMTADITVSNMYLWRGQNVGEGGAVSGTLAYSHDSGFYAGMWTTSEKDGTETDLYFGYAGEFSGISYDVSYWEYLYPEDGAKKSGLDEEDLSEVVVGLGYGPVSLGVYFANDTNGGSDYEYFTLGYEHGKFGVIYGWFDYEVDAGNNDYSHITASYAATDELSFSISVLDNEVPDTDSSALQEDPLFQVSYTKSFDLE